MRICVLASGSKGNATYIEGDNTRILIDAGISCSEIENRLMQIGVNPSLINSILITHEHSDHINGLSKFAVKYNTKVYTHRDTWLAMDSKMSKLKENQKIDIYGNDFCINELNISCFDLDHDAAHCLGYSVSCRDSKVSIATDLGHTTPEIIRHLMDSSLIVFESNHDIQTLLHNPNYPLRLKNRILSNNGHLSNDATSDAVAQMLGYGVRAVILAHLSEQNNTPQKALQTMQQRLLQEGADLAKEIYLDVGKQHKIGNIYKIKE